MKHTSEPWNLKKVVEEYGTFKGRIYWFIVSHDYGHLAELFPTISPGETEANASRIVACVNGCQGINPDAVPDLLAALKNVISRVYLPEGWEQDVVDAIAKATEER